MCYFAATSAEAQRSQTDILKVTQQEQNQHWISGDSRWHRQVLVEGRAGCQPGPWLTALAPGRSSSPRRCCRAHPP